MDANEAEVLPVILNPYDYWKHPSGQSVVIVGEGFVQNQDHFGNSEQPWIPAVMYKNPYGENPEMIYSRSKESFFKKFKPA